MDIALLGVACYFLIGFLFSLLHIKKVEPNERKDWITYSLVNWPIYLLCEFVLKTVVIIEFVQKHIKKYKK